MSADPTTTAAAGISAADVKSLIGEALTGFGATLATQLAEQQKAHTDALAAVQKTFTESLAKIPTGIKVEDVGKVVADQLAARETAQGQAKSRADFIANELKGVPEVYHAKVGTEVAGFTKESAQAIRAAYQKDLESAGIKAPPVTSNAAGGGTAADAIGTAKLSGAQLVAQGVKASGGAVIPPSGKLTDPAVAMAAAVAGGATNAALASAAGGAAK